VWGDDWLIGWLIVLLVISIFVLIQVMHQCLHFAILAVRIYDCPQVQQIPCGLGWVDTGTILWPV
jgi:hypothetical protein